jgi:hypothetical protein
MLLRNVGWLSADYTALYPRRLLSYIFVKTAVITSNPAKRMNGFQGYPVAYISDACTRGPTFTCCSEAVSLSVCSACIASLHTRDVHIQSTAYTFAHLGVTDNSLETASNYNKICFLINSSVESPSYYSDRITNNVITGTPTVPPNTTGLLKLTHRPRHSSGG